MSVRVVAPAVQVTVGARVYFLEAGAVLPEGVDEETLERFVSDGLVVDDSAPKSKRGQKAAE